MRLQDTFYVLSYSGRGFFNIDRDLRRSEGAGRCANDFAQQRPGSGVVGYGIGHDHHCQPDGCGAFPASVTISFGLIYFSRQLLAVVGCG